MVFDDGTSESKEGNAKNSNGSSNDSRKATFTGLTDPNHFLLHILSYLETPPYLRTKLYSVHPNLKSAGALPSLDMPHHLRSDEWCRYREGISVEPPNTEAILNGMAKGQKGTKKKDRKDIDNIDEQSTYVHVGFTNPVSVPTSIPTNTRVTLKFPKDITPEDTNHGLVTAEAIASSQPREEAGYYWGYDVRSAKSFSSVLTECPFDGGYDLTIGTSERGLPISAIQNPTSDLSPVPEFSHMLVVFGGIAGLEVAVKADEELQRLGVTEPSDLFEYWVNLCPGQGSRTIRTEEALWIGLMGLRDIVVGKGRKSQ